MPGGRFSETLMAETTLDPSTQLLEQFANKEYEHGWNVEIDVDQFEPGLSEDVVRRISAKKEEPEWLLDWRLKAYRHFLTMKEPEWHNVTYEKPDLQALAYYSAPKDEARPQLPGRGRSGDAARLHEARHPHRGAEGPPERRGRRPDGRRGERACP